MAEVKLAYNVSVQGLPQFDQLVQAERGQAETLAFTRAEIEGLKTAFTELAQVTLTYARAMDQLRQSQGGGAGPPAGGPPGGGIPPEEMASPGGHGHGGYRGMSRTRIRANYGWGSSILAGFAGGMGVGAFLGVGSAVSSITSTLLQLNDAMRQAEATFGGLGSRIGQVGHEFAYTGVQAAGFMRTLSGFTGGTGGRLGRDVGTVEMWARATGIDPMTFLQAGRGLRLAGALGGVAPTMGGYLGMVSGMGAATGMIGPGNLGLLPEVLAAAVGMQQMMGAYRDVVDPGETLRTQAWLGQMRPGGAGESFRGLRGLGTLATMQGAMQTQDDYKRAFIYRTLRQIRPGASITELEMMRERPLTPETIQAMIGGTRGMRGEERIWALSELFGIKKFQAADLLNLQGKVTEEDLKNLGLKDKDLQEWAKRFQPLGDTIKASIEGAVQQLLPVLTDLATLIGPPLTYLARRFGDQTGKPSDFTELIYAGAARPKIGAGYPLTIDLSRGKYHVAGEAYDFPSAGWEGPRRFELEPESRRRTELRSIYGAGLFGEVALAATQNVLSQVAATPETETAAQILGKLIAEVTRLNAYNADQTPALLGIWDLMKTSNDLVRAVADPGTLPHGFLKPAG